MIEKNMKSRHVQKHATESEWLKANIFIPKQAEIIVYDVDENHPYERFKIGDGVTLLADLPFSNENADSTGGSSFDIIITSQEQFLSSDLTDKKVLIKDTALLLSEIDCKGAKYVEFCNVGVTSTQYQVTIKNFKRGNFMGLYPQDLNIDGTMYHCDDLIFGDFGIVENYDPDDEARQHHAGGRKFHYLNGLGIMNSYISYAANCCNIINCHIQGRSEIIFYNCSTILNIHDVEVESPEDFLTEVIFENCSHLSNIELNDSRKITYINCSKVDPDTCDGYEGNSGVDLSGYATKKDIDGYTVEYNEYDSNLIERITVNAGDGDLNTVRLMGGSTYDVGKSGIHMSAAASMDNFCLSVDNSYGDTTLEINAVDGELNFYHTDLSTNESKSKTVAFIEDIDEKLGDIDSVLDAILAKQNAVLGGNS